MARYDEAEAYRLASMKLPGVVPCARCRALIHEAFPHACDPGAIANLQEMVRLWNERETHSVDGLIEEVSNPTFTVETTQ